MKINILVLAILALALVLSIWTYAYCVRNPIPNCRLLGLPGIPTLVPISTDRFYIIFPTHTPAP